MLITTEHTWKTFPFSLQAENTVSTLSDTEMDTVWDVLEQLFPDGIDQHELNEFFINSTNTIAEWLGYESWKQLIEEKEAE